MEGGGNGAQLPPGTSFFLEGNPGLPKGLHVDPYVYQGTEDIFRIILVNQPE